VTAAGGIHVYSRDGKQLGVIETKRRPISLAFSGPDKKTLYVASMGAVGPNGKAFVTPKGVRNTSMTLYKMQMEAQGYMGRPK
jgi:sugar lactone lactonase YvrE